MRICTEKSTGVLIEMQSNATEGTLTQNAVNCGYSSDDIEEREVTPQEYQEVLSKQPVTIDTRKAAIDAALAYVAKQADAPQEVKQYLQENP